MRTATAQATEHFMTIYELLTTYRVRCGSFTGRGWVAWCWVNGRMVECGGESPVNAVENLRGRIEDLSVMFRMLPALARLDDEAALQAMGEGK